MISSSGTLVKYYYDALNRLTNVVDRFNDSTVYGFDAAGNLQRALYQNNVTNAYAYDALNRLTNMSVTSASGTIASFAYKLAQAGNRTNLAANINGAARTNAWAYDPLYRLTNEVITGATPTGTIGYGYDAIGNRTNRASTVSGISAANSTYNINDWVTGDTYDNNGSTTASGGINYGYDAENHLTNYNNGAAILVYDGDGNRVRKTVGGVTTYYLVDDRNPSGYTQVIEELSTGDQPRLIFTPTASTSSASAKPTPPPAFTATTATATPASSPEPTRPSRTPTPTTPSEPSSPALARPRTTADSPADNSTRPPAFTISAPGISTRAQGVSGRGILFRVTISIL